MRTHRPETRGACHRAALRADPVALLTMRVRYSVPRRQAIASPSKTIRHPIQDRTPRLARRARILHRHMPALAVAREHPGPDHHRRLVADDHARMRRSQPRRRAVGPHDGVTLVDAAPPVVAGNIVALPRTGLRERG